MTALKIENGSLRDLARRIRSLDTMRPVVAAFETMAAATLAQARGMAPVRTEVLRRSGYMKRRRVRRVANIQIREIEVGFKAPYAVYQEKGVLQSYPIVPRSRSKSVLRWVSLVSNEHAEAGDVVFRQKVQHPGFKPHPFLVPAADAQFARFNRKVPLMLRGMLRP